MADGTVRVNFAADITDVRKGTRDVVKELDKVNRAADKSSAAAAKGSGRAVSGILRMVETGKVSAKGLDKIGRSASTLLSGLSPIGIGLGLGALPLLSDVAVAAIKGIRRSTESLTDRINQSAAAMRQANIAQLAAAGALDAITQADLSAKDAHKALNDARAAGNVTTDEMTRLELAASAADRDAALARIASAAANVEATKKQKEFAGTVADTIKKATVMSDAVTKGSGAIVDQAATVKSAAAALREHAHAAEGLTDAERASERSLADFIETAGMVPSDIPTVLALIGAGYSTEQILAFLGLTKKIPKKKTTKVEADGVPEAVRRFNQARDSANQIPRSVTTYVTVKRSDREGPSGGTQKTPAVGARIAGRFDGKDNIPTWVSKGEVILNPRQQSLIDGGMSIDGALGATGALTIRAGGGFAGGGKASDRNQRLLDRAKDRFGATMSADDLLLARAERTPTFSDDRGVLLAEQRHIIARIKEIRKLRRRKGLTRQQRQDLNDEEASLTRQLSDIGGQLAPAPVEPGDTTGAGAAAVEDPFALQRATDAGMAAGLGRAAGYVFGGSGDIGSGGASALGAAGSIPSLHVESVTFTNSVQNQGQIARASNVGNDVLSGGRVRSSRARVSF